LSFKAHSSIQSIIKSRNKFIKKSFIELVKILEQHDLIKPKYKILSNGNLHDTQQFTLKNSEIDLVDRKSTIEAKTVLQCEQENLVWFFF
jgi:hypothetical protein